MIVVAVVLSGALGAVARFVVDGAIRSRLSTTFPWATFAINVSGSLLLGVLAGLVIAHSAPGTLLAVFGTGFCGGYTTFSTTAVDTVRLAEGRRTPLAVLNAVGSVTASVGACALGLAVTSL